MNPDDKLLPPPADKKGFLLTSKTNPKNIYNPDDRLLVPPPKENLKDKKLTHSSGLKIPAKHVPSKNETKENELKK